jgi:hypothetical protein
VAGTWSRGAHSVVVSGTGGCAAATARAARGNFHADADLGAITGAAAGGSTMDPPPSYGGCNACHGSGGGDD